MQVSPRVCQDINNDYYLVTATIIGNSLTAKLKCSNTNKEITLELRYHFSVLADTADENPDIMTKWDSIKNIYDEMTIKDLNYRKHKKKECLIPTTKRQDDEQSDQGSGSMSKKSIKKSARTDRRSFLEELDRKPKYATARGEMSVVYK